jgi:hypothetical protein
MTLGPKSTVAELVLYHADAISGNYIRSSVKDRKDRLKEALFLRTWCLSGGKELPSTTPPTTKYARMNHLWWGKIPLEVIEDYILIRDVGLDASGKLDKITLNLAAKLQIANTTSCWSRR